MDKIIIPEGQRSRVYDIMRKLVLKTALITLGVVLVLAVAAFGVISLCAPAVMCDFTLSLGMESVSADYAYQEYQRSGDLAYLARSVELAAGRNDAKAEEQRTEARIAQYEEKMAFGDYRIVRKKSNGRYGAIDENGYEKIPCRYLSVGIAEGGRAFERTDNLFDIYNTKGELITEGATYY